MSLDLDIRRALVMMAHPDDPEFSAGGTIALWTRMGVEVGYVIITSGDKGSDDPNANPAELMRIRESEQQAAAARLGVNQVVFLHYRDNELVPTIELRRDLAREICRFRPEAIIAQDPTTVYFGPTGINHPDHRAAGEAVLAAIYPTSRDWLNLPDLRAEGLQPHKVREVLLSGTLNPDYWVDITATIDTKIAALREHRSQIKDPEGLAQRIYERGLVMAEGQPFKYAERFKRIIMP